MKFDDSSNAVIERSGLTSEKQFGILFNAKMSAILSNGLYSDKIQSIIRELSCNAVDSHIESGQADRAVEVHLPTTWEPWFHVRDFGVGLDDEQVCEIYTIYGASTKTHTNDLTGAFGLGSKSPFSYVDAFDVTARKNGVERQYSMYKSEDGMPSVAMLGEFATTEPNGVTVKMPVKQEDIRRFSEKAALVFSWFSIKPLITGVSDLKIPENTAAYQGDGWKIRKRAAHVYSSDPVNRPVALMGRVAYPLDASGIADLTVAQKTLLEIPTVLLFDIGELEVAASREGLGYDKRTQDNIRNKLDIVLAELAKEFEKKIAAAATEWEARRLFGEIFGNDGGFRHEFAKAFGNKGLMWQGKLIKDAHITIKTSDIWDSSIVYSPLVWRTYSHYKTLRKMNAHEHLTLRCTSDIMFVFDDLDRGAQSRINYLHQSNSQHKEIFVFGPSDLKTVADIATMLGNPEYKMASELPKRPSVARGARTTMLEYRTTVDDTGVKAWAQASVDLDDGGLYVAMDRYTVMDGVQHIDNLYDIREKAIEVGIIDKSQQIYSPRAEMRKKVAEHGDWINFFDLLREEITARLTPAVLQAVADLNEYNAVVQVARDTSVWQHKLNIQNTQGVFAQFVSAMQTFEDTYKKSSVYRSLINLALMFGKKIALPAPSVDAQGLHKMMLASYPMLELVFDRYSSRNINSANAHRYSDYINMCDEYSTMKMETAVESLIAA